MTGSIAPFVIGFLIGVPMLGALYAAPLIFGRHMWGRAGLWAAALICCVGMGWAIVNRDPSIFHQAPKDFAFVACLFAALGTVPAYLVDRVSLGSPMPPVWKRVAWSIGGLYLGAIATFVVAALVLLGALAINRL